MSQYQPRLGLSTPKIIAGALAAASAAVASSWLGLAGTVFGAVVVSVVASVGTALYATPIERSSQLVRNNLPPRLARAGTVGAPEQTPDPDDNRPLPAAAVAAAAPTGLAADASVADAPGQKRGRSVRWAGVAVAAVAMLSLGLGLLTGFEALVGKPAASLVGSGGGGGTTLGRIVQPDDAPQPSGPDNSSPASPTTQADTGGPDDQSPGGATEEPTTSAPMIEGATTSAPTTSAPTTSVPSTSAGVPAQ